MMASTISSEVAAASFALPKIVPQAHHLARRLIVSRVVISRTSKLKEPPVVCKLNWCKIVELLHPDTQIHIFHLEQLVSQNKYLR